MKIDELQYRLSELDPIVLQNFVLELYQNYPALSDVIETLVLFNDPSAIKQAIAKRIQSIKRGRKFIDYYASSEFARNLDSIVSDIETGLLEASPKDAFELIDKFIATSDSVMNRVDDSSGEIGSVYQNAVLLWLDVAKAWGHSKADWFERVYRLYQMNDYGVLDSLLPNSNRLLNEEQLRQLARRYEGEIREAQKQPVENGRINMQVLQGCVALGQVAEALKDPVLYEHSVLIDSPEPNELQKRSIVSRYIKFNQLEPALRWLGTDWGKRFELDRLNLLEQVYEQSENNQKLRDIRHQLYQQEPNYNRFIRYLETLNEDEQSDARKKAIEQAEQGGNIVTSADLLLQLGETERAQKMLISRYQELSQSYYENLTSLVAKFEKANCPLAVTACYRALLLDILNQGRSKAYTHAARYYKKLQVLAREVHEFQPLIGHLEFMDQLSSDHGRKSSFWRRVTKQYSSHYSIQMSY